MVLSVAGQAFKERSVDLLRPSLGGSNGSRYLAALLRTMVYRLTCNNQLNQRSELITLRNSMLDSHFEYPLNRDTKPTVRCCITKFMYRDISCIMIIITKLLH